MTDILARVVIKKHRRSRRLRLTVRDDGSVRLTMPRSVSFAVAKRFLQEQREWIVAAHGRVLQRPARLLTQGDQAEYRAHKEVARQRIAERTVFFEAFYGVTHRRLSIRNQRTRFGSCSARGHLSFNYRLIFLPSHLLDYVVAHEVCHLRELNHSQKFWALVAEMIPDFQEKKRELQAFARSGE